MRILDITAHLMHGTAPTRARKVGPVARILLTAAFALAAFPGVGEAQSGQWASNNCFYTPTAAGWRTDLCRQQVAPYTHNYWNPVTGQWLVQIADNPANPYQDVFLLTPQMYGWGARFAVARPGQAVVPGAMAIRDPRGVWTNVSASRNSPEVRNFVDLINMTLSNNLGRIRTQ